jgi:hypothetical protein
MYAMDNNTFVGILGSTSAVDNLALSLRGKKQGRGYVIADDKIVEYQFHVQTVQLKDGRFMKIVNPSLKWGRMIRIVNSDASEPKKKTKRGRR